MVENDENKDVYNIGRKGPYIKIPLAIFNII